MRYRLTRPRPGPPRHWPEKWRRAGLGPFPWVISHRVFLRDVFGELDLPTFYPRRPPEKTPDAVFRLRVRLATHAARARQAPGGDLLDDEIPF